MKDLRSLPGIDSLLNLSRVKLLIEEYGRDLAVYALRKTIATFRTRISKGETLPSAEEIVDEAEKKIHCIFSGSLKPVINATGVIIHTNLGRVSFGKELLYDTENLLSGYSNLEFDLGNGIRSDRNFHASELLKFITGAEDVLIVNNNAAAVLLILTTLANDKEVIISRGELIEIGGSFRMPDIMAQSGCKMVEVGTTNKTRISDYSKAITENCALLFKAHKSNFDIRGFTEEASLEELVKLGRKANIPVVYDMGSGLLKNTGIPALRNEPNVKQALHSGVDLVCFSGDKLLGGPQSGIIIGSPALIARLKKHPLTRAIRVCKITLGFLENTCRYYLDDRLLFEKNMIFRILTRPKAQLKANAMILRQGLLDHSIHAKVIKSKGQCGGGTMAGTTLESYAVRLNGKFRSGRKSSTFAETFYMELLRREKPVLGVLMQGHIQFDLLTLSDDEIGQVITAICETWNKQE